MENEEIKSVEDATSKNRLKHAEYKRFKVKAKSISTLLGGAIASPSICVKHSLKQLNMFERVDANTIKLPARWFRAMLRTGSRLIDEGDSLIQYVYTNDVLLKNPKIRIESIQSNPIVMGKHQGKGSVNFEAIDECTIETEIMIPIKYLGINKAKDWLKKSFELEGTGAFRKGYGRFQVESIKVEAF
jgi:hypothetical protein